MYNVANTTTLRLALFITEDAILNACFFLSFDKYEVKTGINATETAPATVFQIKNPVSEMQPSTGLTVQW